MTSRGELGRGERVLPGVYRLRLPLPWPGVPHCNAWALSSPDGFVLVDTGMHNSESMAHLEHVTFALPEGRAIEGLQARVAAAGIPARADAGVIEVTDPSGNRLIFRSEAEAQESATP